MFGSIQKPHATTRDETKTMKRFSSCFLEWLSEKKSIFCTDFWYCEFSSSLLVVFYFFCLGFSLKFVCTCSYFYFSITYSRFFVTNLITSCIKSKATNEGNKFLLTFKHRQLTIPKRLTKEREKPCYKKYF